MGDALRLGGSMTFIRSASSTNGGHAFCSISNEALPLRVHQDRGHHIIGTDLCRQGYLRTYLLFGVDLSFANQADQLGNGISPTQDIRELLKQSRFYWSPSQKVWSKRIDEVSYNPNQLQQGEWYVKANGIIVSVYDSDRKVVDEFIK